MWARDEAALRERERDAAVRATARDEAALRRSASDSRVRYQQPSPSVMTRPPPPLPTGESDTKTPRTEEQASDQPKKQHRSRPRTALTCPPPPLPTGQTDTKTPRTEEQAFDQAKKQHRSRPRTALERRANLSLRKAEERHASENCESLDKESRLRSSETLAMHNALTAVLNRQHKWPFVRPIGCAR